MRVTVIPHGSLLDTWPERFECEARSPAQAINAISRQFKLAKKGERFSQVRIVGIDSEIALNSPCALTQYHVVPDFSGGGGFIKILIGLVIIAVAVFLTPFSPGINMLLIGMGASLVLGGVMDLISPAPKLQAPKNTGDSLYLGAPLNTTQVGTPIVIGYGRFAVYGQYLSYNIQAAQVGSQTGLISSSSSTGVTSGGSLDGHGIISIL